MKKLNILFLLKKKENKYIKLPKKELKLQWFRTVKTGFIN